MDIANSAMTGKEAGSLSPLQLLNILRSASGALCAQASLHAQLAQVEWEEEKQRLCKMALMGVLGFVFFLCFILLLSALAVVLAWSTPYRIHVFVGVTIVHFIGLIWTGLCVKKLAELSSKSFAATRAEIASDIALLKSAL